jgi:regulator of protease activity HflC (stomatin/prohibitin superfamily)
MNKMNAYLLANNGGAVFGIIAGIIVLIILIYLGVTCIKIVRQSDAVIVERLGAYNRTLSHGLHLLTPIIEKAVHTISLKERVCDFKPQPVITKDNVTMQIDTVVYFYVTDPKLFTYGVERPISAIENLTATTLRNIIGELELDQTLTSRDTINTKMRLILDEATDPWGIKVTRVELKNILPPREIQDAMEKQMRAERERRESILRAEGDKQSQILIAEGEKESTILRAEAEKAKKIAEAEAQAESIRLVYEAQARGIELINKANPTKEYVTLEGYKALEKVANGQSTKLIIPSELTNLASTLASASEIVKENKK